jgi:membrane peptidoglycan carboxypeptidase
MKSRLSEPGRVLNMKKFHQVAAMPLLLALLSTFLIISSSEVAYAKRQRRATKAKTKSKSGRTQSARASARQTKRAARSQPQLSKQQLRTLLARQRRGKLTASERRLLATYRSSSRRRANAIRLARLRAVRAHDAALRNIAANNILGDDATGEDREVRRAAVEALGGRSGTVVVVDPHTGRVYTIVNQRMALGSPVKPCSTVKLIVGLAALHENAFDPNQDVQLARNGWGMNLTDALARSNNPFFQVLGRKLGYERVIKYSENFGFGEKTGINYPGESEGFLPEEGQEETGHMSSHGDGFGVTAMQLAAFTAAIANGGNLYVPRTPRTPEEAADFKPELRRKIEISSEDRLRILSGMIGAVNFGTAKLAYDPAGQVAGKTGTCTGNGDRLGLFTSFSSINNPKLVVTVITTGSTEAGKRAAEIAGRIYRTISPRFLRETPFTPASAVIEVPNKTAGAANN